MPNVSVRPSVAVPRSRRGPRGRWGHLTFDLLVDVGFRLHAVQRFRLRGVDTPEIYGVDKQSDEYARGIDAMVDAREWLDEHMVDGLTAVSFGETSFSRWVGDVECSLPGHGDLGSWLVAEGHGQEVDG